MSKILNILSDKKLQYHEKRASLAYEAECSLPYVDISAHSKKFLQANIICDIYEGHAPYRPRYILPDYSKYFANGSAYLNISPPKDLYEAINALLVIYRYTPSITTYPVYLGQLDELLEPFANTVTESERQSLVKMFLTNIDRCYPDGFVHANIGPRETVIGRTILEAEQMLKNAVPNISLKLSVNTPDSFLKLAVETTLTVSKPYFVNDDLLSKELTPNYGIASCYNSLKIGGGSHTLVRLNLKKLANSSADYNDFINNQLPTAVKSLCEIINARARFVVEESNFFESSFLAKEGLIDVSNFTSMAGIFGLYDCVEILTSGKKMGPDSEANHKASEILNRTHSLIKSFDGLYCDGYDGKISFHAQSGIESDIDTSEGIRFKNGCEPELFDQILIQSYLQKHFDSGVSDIYLFDQTAKNNIDALVQIIRGAMKNNIKIMSLYSKDSELVRITGYLVKRSDIESYNNGEHHREDTVKLGALHANHTNVFGRTVRSL